MEREFADRDIAESTVEPKIVNRSKRVKSLDETRALRVKSVMSAARKVGLLSDKEGRIGGRVSQTLIEEAKRQTGLQSDTDLIEFALASLALDDPFPLAFKKARGTVDPTLDLSF